MLQAIEDDDPFRIKAAQEFYLKSSETLRRLDLAVETERRASAEMVSKKQAEDVSRQISEWMRVGFMQFLSSESPALVRIDDLGSFQISRS